MLNVILHLRPHMLNRVEVWRESWLFKKLYPTSLKFSYYRACFVARGIVLHKNPIFKAILLYLYVYC